MKLYIKDAQSILVFATRRSDIAAAIEENTRELITHLIKLWIFSDVKDCDHWKQEIYNFLHRVPRLRGSKKFPSKKFILNNTIDINRSNISALLRIVLRDYSNCYRQRQKFYSTMEVRIDLYFAWLADELSKYGQVARNDVYAKLSELGFCE